MAKVSVILPIYNGEKTLVDTLESLAQQSYQDFELVTCIDGTKDRSKEIVLSYVTKFQSVTLLENEINRGLGSTMNRLVANTKGEYIAVAEQDDYYYPERLALQVEVLDKKEEVGMVSGIAEFWNGKTVVSKFPGILDYGGVYPEGKEMFLLNFRKQIKVVNSCMMFRKSVHVDNGLYFTQHYPSISVDWTYVLRFCLVSKIDGLHEVLVRLDRSPERNSVTSQKEKQFKAARELIRSFAYEYPDIITQKDYEYAMNTERLLELGHNSKIEFLKKSIWYMIKFNNDRRFRDKLLNRISKKIK